MTVQEALALLSDEAKEKLRILVSKPEDIDVSKKVGNDIVMGALCKAVMTGVIQPKSLTDKIVKLLNSDTNTISDIKLDEILKSIHHTQPKMYCIIKTKGKVENAITHELTDVTTEYRLYENFSFMSIFSHFVSSRRITPQMVREKLKDTLKMTIVNNVSQVVSKYLTLSSEGKTEEIDNMRVSITTITRLVNMMDWTIVAEFKECNEDVHDNRMVIY